MNEKPFSTRRFTHRVLVVAVAALIGALLSTGVAVAGVGTVTLVRTGSPGDFGEYSAESCYAPGTYNGITSGVSAGVVQDYSEAFSRSPLDPSLTQTVGVVYQLQWWNGSAWIDWLRADRSISVPPGVVGYHNPLNPWMFSFSGLPSGYYYKVVVALQWSVGSTVLGSALYGIVNPPLTVGPVVPFPLANGEQSCHMIF